MINYHTHCLPLVHWNAAFYPCQLWFNNELGIVYSSPQAQEECCLFVPDVGAVPPNFLAPFNFSDVENADNYYGDSVSCNHWTGPESFGFWTAASSGVDIKFKDGPTSVTWNVGKFNVTSQPDELFQLPTTGDCSKKCGFLKDQSYAAEDLLSLVSDPMVRLALLHHLHNN